MKLSIRTRLTLLISAVFFCVLGLLLISGGMALYMGFTEEIDQTLKAEERWIRSLYDREYSDLETAGGEERRFLRKELLEDLREVHGYKLQFSIFSLYRDDGEQLYSQGKIDDVQGFLPADLLARRAGFYSEHLNGVPYRIFIGYYDWGALVIGIQNRLFYEVIDELHEILIVGIPLILLLVLLVSRILARLVMKPVIAAAAAAEDISLKNLQTGLPAYRGSDEFGVLMETLDRMIQRIDGGVRQVRQFTQDAAHELRTPLTVIRGQLEQLYQDEQLPEAARETLQKSLDRAIAMGKIIDNLMLLARSDAGRYPIEKKQIRLDIIMAEVVEDIRLLAADRPLDIRLHNNEVTMSADRSLLQRLLRNLAENALKFTREGHISFSLQALPSHARITIEDSGIGIPEAELPLIFNRFHRVEKSRSSLSGGSGLGLAICQWIVEAHRGSIEIANIDGGGIRVTVLLPLNTTP